MPQKSRFLWRDHSGQFSLRCSDISARRAKSAVSERSGTARPNNVDERFAAIKYIAAAAHHRNLIDARGRLALPFVIFPPAGLETGGGWGLLWRAWSYKRICSRAPRLAIPAPAEHPVHGSQIARPALRNKQLAVRSVGRSPGLSSFQPGDPGPGECVRTARSNAVSG